MRTNSICYTCRSYADNSVLQKLRSIENIVNSVKSGLPPVGSNMNWRHLEWDTYKRCRFGMSCAELHTYNTKCDAIESRISPYILPIAEHAADSEEMMSAYNQILRLCSGSFPRIYRQMETERAKNKK